MNIDIHRASAIFFLIVVCTAGNLAFANVAQDDAAIRYNQANALYQSGDFKGALRVYEELIARGISHPDLFYNTSNAAYRTGSLGKAILYLEKAYRLAPSEPDIRANRDFLNSMKQDREPPVDNVVAAFFENFYNEMPVSTTALWSSVMFAVSMVFACTALFTGGWTRKTLIGIALLCGCVVIVSTGVFIQKAHRTATMTEAVIMTDEANAYSGPGAENTHIFTIHEGTTVIIERSQNSWNLIHLRSGAGGWIHADSMEKI